MAGHNLNENPKLAGSYLIDCIPQSGECPNKCSECFYNGGRFFRPLTPMIPTREEARGKIVRMNSGHDSNLKRSLVIQTAGQYEHVFFNTSIPRFSFPGPVVFTANRQCPQNQVHLIENPPDNLMFVRVRVSSWDMETVEMVVRHYWEKYDVPVVLTFMRFYNGDLIPDKNKIDYEWKEHIINDYWVPTTETVLRVLAHFKSSGVRMCGTLVSSLCRDCRNCEFLYWDCLRRMGE